MYTLNGWWFLSCGGSYPLVFTVDFQGKEKQKKLLFHCCLFHCRCGIVGVVDCWFVVSSLFVVSWCTYGIVVVVMLWLPLWYCAVSLWLLYCSLVVGMLWLLYCCFVVVHRCFLIHVIVVSLSFHHCFSIFFVCVTLFSCVVLLLFVWLCCCCFVVVYCCGFVVVL